MFQRGHESLRSQVLRVSELRESFWRESTSKQPDCKKLQALVKQNYAVQQSVYTKTHRLTKLFSQDKSPIVLYPLISSYSKFILNKNISSTLSPYKCLYQKYQKQLEEFEKEGWGRLNEGKAAGNFGILESIGVCLVDLEQDKGKIEWGNGGFWGEVYGKFGKSKQNSDESTTERHKKTDQTFYPNINDFILPDLQQLHTQSLKNLSQSASHLYTIHSQGTFLYQPQSKLLHPFQLHIQLQPSLLNGLKACCFFTEIPPNDTMSTFTLLMKHQSWEVVGRTEGFGEWRDLLLGEGEGQDDSWVDGRRGALGELKQAIEKISAKKEEAQSKDGKKDENQSQTPNIPITEQNKQKPLKVLINDHTFAITLTNLFKQKAQSGPTLFQLQFTQLSQQNDPSSFSNQKTSTVINVTEEQIDVKSQSSNVSSSLNSRDILRGLGLMRSLQKSDEDLQTINEDTDHVINDNATHSKNYPRKRKTHTETDITKTYTTFTATKQTPKAIKTWTIATVATILLLFSAILSNICIFNYRQSQYQQSDQSIKYYNELITDIGQLIIALRQYNYYAFFRGPQDPHIPLLIKQVDTEEEQVNFKLNKVSKYLNEKWQAMEVDHNNSFKYVLEEDYIVIADFMLSSMTYISEVSPEEMTFPIFWGDHPKGQDLTKTQVNFYDAVYNGIYVVLENLNRRKAGFMNEVLGGINRWKTKLYVYPCCAGLLLIIIFIIISTMIEKRASLIRQSAVRMLSEVTYRQKNDKLKAIEQFRQINDFQQVKSNQQSKEDAMSYVQKTLSTFNIEHRIKRFGGMIPCDKSNRITDKTPTGNPQTSRQTKRQLTEDCKTIDEVVGLEKTEDSKDDERVFMELPRKNRSLLFYTIVCAPAVAYLIGILIGGLTMDDFMAEQLQMDGLIHSKKSNLEQVLILTRRTFYYESFIGTDPQKWSAKGISFIQDIFWQNRKLQSMIESNQNSHLNKLTKEINYKNLCNYLGEFPRSDYFSVKFTQQQCKQFANGLFLNGMKSTEVLYMESSLNLFTQVKDPSLLTREERYEYIKGPQIKAMKVMLAYLEIFMDMMKHAFEMDLMEQMHAFFGRVNVLSGVAMGVVLLLAVGVKLRANKIRKGRKFSAQIVEMISLKTIKQCSRLRDCWGNIDVRFYE